MVEVEDNAVRCRPNGCHCFPPCFWNVIVSFHIDTWHAVRKTINSPLLTYKLASSLSLIRMYVRHFIDAYLRPKSNLTHKLAKIKLSVKPTNFSRKVKLSRLFR